MAIRPGTTKKKVKEFPANHPINNVESELKLVDYIKIRLEFSKNIRAELVARLEQIDKQVSGFIKLDKDAKEAEKQTQKGDPTPGKVNLQLVHTQLDDTVTFLMSVFQPDSTLYESLADNEDQSAAKAFAKLMNKNSKIMGYYVQYFKSVWDTLKYNLGGMSVNWDKIVGPKVTRTADGGVQEEQNVNLWEGNRVSSIDLYNFLWDVSHHPVDLPIKGEFYAEVDMHTKFNIQRMSAKKEIFGIDKFIEEQALPQNWYKIKPDIRTPSFATTTTSDATTSGNFDWVSLLSQGLQSGSGTHVGFEFVKYVGWIVPTDFNLSSSKELQIWRIIMVGSKHIVSAEHLNYAHGRLPCAFGSPMESNLGLQEKSVAEILIPLQTFGSFLINTHMASNRKSLFGIQAYDPSILPLGEIGKEVSARIPVKPAGYGKDIRNAFTSFNDAPDTGSTMSDLNNVIELMQYILPTDQQKQVADLDRATQYHAAATVQGGNRRHLRIARTLNDQMFINIRMQQLYNIIQFQPSIELPGPNGQTQEISPKQFNDLDFEFIIDEGLKQLDRLSLILSMKDVINAILQSPTASQEFDVVGLINYWASLQGDATDLTVFRRPQAQINPETGEPLPNTQPAPGGETATGPTPLAAV